MKKVVKIENIDCAVCAAKLERAISGIDGVNNSSINFITQKLILDINESSYATTVEKIYKIAKKVEPDCKIIGL